MFLLQFLSSVLYASLGLVLFRAYFLQQQKIVRSYFTIIGVIWLLHTVIVAACFYNDKNLLLWHTISTEVMLLSVAWLLMLCLLVYNYLNDVTPLIAIMCLFSAASIMLLMLEPISKDPLIQNGLQKNLHIGLALVASVIIALAFVQGIFVAILQGMLRRHPTRSMGLWPSLETMERTLFQIIGLGFALLSILIFSSFSAFSHVFAPNMFSKILLTIACWVIFATLLFGRFYFGWRGTVALRFTLAGSALLFIILVISSMLGA